MFHNVGMKLLLLTAALFATGVAAPSIVVNEAPAHLNQARQLVDNLKGTSLNEYGGGKRHIDWDMHPCEARTVCSSFTTLLLEHSYNWPAGFMKKWVGDGNPMAADYYDAIVAHNGFLQVVHVGKIEPGDILAVRYTDHHVSRNGVEDTGHVMVVDQVVEGREDKEPLKAGLKQYFISVIDSSASGHGTSDTRRIGKGQYTGGIGKGIMRIYADSDDHIAGYTWSDQKNSEFFSAPSRILVIGRLDPDRLPKP